MPMAARARILECMVVDSAVAEREIERVLFI
jgi:hypothetical protein